VHGAKTYFEAGRLSYEVGYLKPAKRNLIDLVVTRTGLDKALSFANQLFLALEQKCHRVLMPAHDGNLHRHEIDWREESAKGHSYNNLWSPGRCTVVYIGTVAIGLTIIEMSEELEARYVNGQYVPERDYVPPKRRSYATDRTWTTKKHFATGRLCLQAYASYWDGKWVRKWLETKDRNLPSRIASIVNELEGSVPEVTRMVEEGKRAAELERQRWEAQQQQWRREEAERRAAKAVKDSKDELRNIIDVWTEANRISQFFIDAESRVENLEEDARERIRERLRLARDLVGAVDALELLMTWKTPDERLSA
jgi:hypothetical protein